ncbi:MAG: MFS transporter, partial [Chloroflexota bacterium]
CYGASSVIVLCLIGDLFQGKRAGSILGGAYVAGGFGAAIGAFFGGYVFDLLLDYRLAFAVTIPGMLLACVLYWLAAPRKVRMVVGRLKSLPQTPQAS